MLNYRLIYLLGVEKINFQSLIIDKRTSGQVLFNESLQNIKPVFINNLFKVMSETNARHGFILNVIEGIRVKPWCPCLTYGFSSEDRRFKPWHLWYFLNSCGNYTTNFTMKEYIGETYKPAE